MDTELVSIVSLDAAVYVLTFMPAGSRTFKEYQINKQRASTVTMAGGGGGEGDYHPPYILKISNEQNFFSTTLNTLPVVNNTEKQCAYYINIKQCI